MSAPTRYEYWRLYREAMSWPVPDRLALVQMLVTSLWLDLRPDGAGPIPAAPEADLAREQSSGTPDESVPRGVPVERILARNIPNFLDDAAVDQLRWQYLSEKYLK
jgi:hypothetical protein